MQNRRALAEGQIVRIVLRSLEFFDAKHHPRDAVIDVCEVQTFFFPEDMQGFAGFCLAEEEGNDADRIIVHAIDIAESPDDRVDPVAAFVGLEERLTADLACGVWTFAGHEVRFVLRIFSSLWQMDIAVRFP